VYLFEPTMGPGCRDCSYSLGPHVVDEGKWYNKVFRRKFAKIPAQTTIHKAFSDFQSAISHDLCFHCHTPSLAYGTDEWAVSLKMPRRHAPSNWIYLAFTT
jgi:hypothetical protein